MLSIMSSAITVGGQSVSPLITPEEGRGRSFIHGRDEDGRYVACRLDNEPGTELAGWYVFVSPEDETLMMVTNWCGEVRCACVQVRRREMVRGSERLYRLNRDLWERAHGNRPTSLVLLTGHPLDFRRDKLICARRRTH